MRYVILAAFVLTLTSAQTAWAFGGCCKKTAPVMRFAHVFDPGAALTDGSIGLSMMAADPAACPGDHCPCCPSGRDCEDCTDCAACAGCVPAFVPPVTSGPSHLYSTSLDIESFETPGSRAIERPGRPPQSILR